MRLILFLGGAAALGWQILWSHHLGLALGASARGVALTVATAMTGMTVGAIFGARFLSSQKPTKSILHYGVLELSIGLLSLLPGLAESGIMHLDSKVHAHWPEFATFFTILSLAASVGPACIAMGATVPVMGMIARAMGRPLSHLYACNTTGAAVGTLATAFFLLPSLGLAGSATCLAAMHLALALACFGISRQSETAGSCNRPCPAPTISAADKVPSESRAQPSSHPMIPVFLSGIATFLLEVSWFRLLRSAWFSTSDSLAVMLFCFLVALATGAMIAPSWRRRGGTISIAFAGAALLVVIATQLIGRFDLVDAFQAKGAWRQISRAFVGLAVIAPPIALLGIVLPTLLDEGPRPRDWAVLYAINTTGSVMGANAAAWLLLEWVGPSATAWIAGGLLTAGALIGSRSVVLRSVSVVGFALVLVPVLWFDRREAVRTRGVSRSIMGKVESIEQRHGPDASISVIAFDRGRALMVNGFVTTAESSRIEETQFQYMDSMGRLPMLLHPDPRDALVICFGTGQTAHAVRDERPKHLDIVDLNPAVFDLGRHFLSNHRVLDDSRVHPHVMDGRAWLRRSGNTYDVITLEPMPPFFSGSNALYSTEFYTLLSSRLRNGGLVAQWFPIHLMTPDQARSIAAAFLAVFPESILWLDPGSTRLTGLPDQGILVGRKALLRKEPPAPLGEAWPGFERPAESGTRNFSATVARNQVVLDAPSLRRFTAGADPVTDDNLLLEYGTSPFRDTEDTVSQSIRRIHQRIESARISETP